MRIKCAHCRKLIVKDASAVGRAKRDGCNLYCDRKCAGLGRRTNKTRAQKVAEKAAYDKEYRAENLAALKAKKRAYFERTYDPVKAAIERKKKMPAHIEYCRQPKYRAYKAEYDMKRRASVYGPFAESYLLLLKLDAEVQSRASALERRMTNGTYNKAQFRRRDYQRLVGNQPEGRAVGHA